MTTYYVNENNSGGRTVALNILDEPAPHWVSIEASSPREAVAKFEKHFNLSWRNENSYEGGSCNCCGRRFSLYVPEGDDEGDDIDNFSSYGAYFLEDGKGLPLEQAPNKSYRRTPAAGRE